MAFEFLQDLTPGERTQLRTQLAYEEREKEMRALTPEDYDFWEMVSAVLPQKSMPLRKFLERFGIRRWDEAMEDFAVSMAHAIPEEGVRKVVRVAVRQLALRCLAEYLKSRQIPLSPRTMLGSLDSLHHAINQSYPGYIDAKILHLAVTVLSDPHISRQVSANHQSL
jgi:hypothetical protein